jgi:hypothetical protein
VLFPSTEDTHLWSRWKQNWRGYIGEIIAGKACNLDTRCLSAISIKLLPVKRRVRSPGGYLGPSASLPDAVQKENFLRLPVIEPQYFRRPVHNLVSILTYPSSHYLFSVCLTLILLMWRIEWAPNIIPIYSYIQQDATLHNLFISGNCSTCFGWYFHPSSGAHTTVSTVTVWQIPDAVDTVVCAPDDGWKYHPKHVEQFPNRNKLCNVASCWIYIGIYLRYTDP